MGEICHQDTLHFLLLTHGLFVPAPVQTRLFEAQTGTRRHCQCVRPYESLAIVFRGISSPFAMFFRILQLKEVSYDRLLFRHPVRPHALLLGKHIHIQSFP